MGPYAGKGEDAGVEASGRLPERSEPSLKTITLDFDLMTEFYRLV
jgi:hypothetical protein